MSSPRHLITRIKQPLTKRNPPSLIPFDHCNAALEDFFNGKEGSAISHMSLGARAWLASYVTPITMDEPARSSDEIIVEHAEDTAMGNLTTVDHRSTTTRVEEGFSGCVEEQSEDDQGCELHVIVGSWLCCLRCRKME